MNHIAIVVIAVIVIVIVAVVDGRPTPEHGTTWTLISVLVLLWVTKK